MKTIPHCIECGEPVTQGVYFFSRRIYGYSLCIKDQCRIEESGATARTADLYLALKARGIPVILEYYDGQKHLDIALPGKLYVEVIDAHQYIPNGSMADLSRTINNLEENIPSIIIQNFQLENAVNFNHVVNEISKACRLMLKKPVVTGMNLMFSRVQLQ